MPPAGGRRGGARRPRASRSGRTRRPRPPRTRARRRADASWCVPPGPTRCRARVWATGPACATGARFAPRRRASSRAAGRRRSPSQRAQGYRHGSTYRSRRSRSRPSSSRATLVVDGNDAARALTPAADPDRSCLGRHLRARPPTATPACAATRPPGGSGSTVDPDAGGPRRHPVVLATDVTDEVHARAILEGLFADCFVLDREARIGWKLTPRRRAASSWSVDSHPIDQLHPDDLTAVARPVRGRARRARPARVVRPAREASGPSRPLGARRDRERQRRRGSVARRRRHLLARRVGGRHPARARRQPVLLTRRGRAHRHRRRGPAPAARVPERDRPRRCSASGRTPDADDWTAAFTPVDAAHGARRRRGRVHHRRPAPATSPGCATAPRRCGSASRPSRNTAPPARWA